MRRNSKSNSIIKIIIIVAILLSGGYGYLSNNNNSNYLDTGINSANQSINVENKNNYDSELIKQKYKGKAYVHINKKPKFKLTTSRYKSYSKRDYLGRCGIAEACVSKLDMPKNKKRGSHRYD